MVDAIANAEGISMSSVSFRALFGKGGYYSNMLSFLCQVIETLFHFAFNKISMHLTTSPAFCNSNVFWELVAHDLSLFSGLLAVIAVYLSKLYSFISILLVL